MIPQFLKARRAALIGLTFALGAGCALTAYAQNAPAPAAAGGANAARAAVGVRKAIFTLIGSNFRPLGALLKDGGPYDAADVNKRITRVLFLSGLLNEAFPDISNVGEPDSKAKPEIWTNRADFEKKLKEFQDNLVVLSDVNAREKGYTESVKVALGAVAQNCKSCHDDYKLK
ncbi:cytochrome c [uncultured Rhodoblastus sp.]|uniref:c-type cytochrome n=1 Tax=uncultured Rhodoblastus sp. TaxID=543037 RepID=UPI0025D6301A|nr:cytochrome c [uncultured Rhodoblastus sp.]